MTQILQPGDVPAWDGDTPANQIDNVFAEQTWPAMWPRMVFNYATTTARDAALAGLGPGDRALAFIDADGGYLTRWDGTAWGTAAKRTFVRAGVTGSTDSNGYLTVNHGAPFTPRVVTVMNTAGASSGALAVSVDSYTSTTCRVRFGSWLVSGIYASASIGTVALISYE